MNNEKVYQATDALQNPITYVIPPNKAYHC
jgi:hypothetical protein